MRVAMLKFGAPYLAQENASNFVRPVRALRIHFRNQQNEIHGLDAPNALIINLLLFSYLRP